MSASQLDSLVSALGAIPPLPGALCKGQSDTWDEPAPASIDPDPDDTQERLNYAVRACGCCPALSACRTWIASLPPRQRPCGVVAGQVRPTKGERSR